VTGFVVASFNIHAGVDGWGRPFDVVAACRHVAADVLVLQEAWVPDRGGPGTAEVVASALGYEVLSQPLARCALLPPSEARTSAAGWGPGFTRSERHRYGPRVLQREEGAEPSGASDPIVREAVATQRQAGAGGVEVPLGTWGLAVLTRVPLTGTRVIDLGRLRRDDARRAAVVVDVDASVLGRPVTVVGTHMSHLTQGSPRQLRRLARALGLGRDGPSDVVVAGDMNLWGPPVEACLTGLGRLVRGRSWPAYRPLAQIDHVLAGPGLAAGAVGDVVADQGSDHRPVRVRFPTPARSSPRFTTP
jgi:endonuclease/exonuclease/phosphatase family metal-dependent hydrolase